MNGPPDSDPTLPLPSEGLDEDTTQFEDRRVTPRPSSLNPISVDLARVETDSMSFSTTTRHETQAVSTLDFEGEPVKPPPNQVPKEVVPTEPPPPPPWILIGVALFIVLAGCALYLALR